MSRLIRAGALLCAIALAAAPSAGRAASKISVGYIPVAEFIPCFVGVEWLLAVNRGSHVVEFR